MTDIRSFYMLDPSVTFLNHGSFGACPIPVFEEYQRWQRELERQPVEFLGRRIGGLIDEAKVSVGQFLNIDPQDFVFMPNATSGVNVIAKSIPLQPGDEVLTTSHEYGACIFAGSLNSVSRARGSSSSISLCRSRRLRISWICSGRGSHRAQR
ncbi:aminotransferase class V-fold PLP-dependent enzyme [Kamptonema cortianum]|nr:aminotransferase class V-fold PLP-dependent enzyme [Kamptonema cortianum]